MSHGVEQASTSADPLAGPARNYSMTKPIIFWYRQDLRVSDHPGLHAAAASGRPVLACYILDDDAAGEWKLGSASRWWLHHSLLSLQHDLKSLGGDLIFRRGDTAAVLSSLVDESGADTVFCSRQHEPWASALETNLHRDLGERDVTLKRYPGALLFEPESIQNQSGLPFKVFTPFWRACLRQAPPQPPLPPAQPDWLSPLPDSESIHDWALTPTAPDWASGWGELWQPGSAGAAERLATFFQGGIHDYSEGRNHPALDTTTRLSPHIHFGEVSPREIWHAAQQCLAANPALQDQADKFLSEMGWREFSHHLLSHFPEIPEAPFKDQFDAFPWLGAPDALRAWQRGQTGYPIVDAGMRELWQTGYMHNRVRMIVASFLTKHLLVHWRAGENWFWDTLLDANLANNACGWQWVAGSGADASPYFRIFNPITQGEKFDKEGDYVREWVPELAALPDKYLNKPWEAPEEILDQAGVKLGTTYPAPIVDHREAREAALTAYGSLKSG